MQPLLKCQKKTSRKYVPRGYRTRYVPGLDRNTLELYNGYKNKLKPDKFSVETMVYREKKKLCEGSTFLKEPTKGK